MSPDRIYSLTLLAAILAAGVALAAALLSRWRQPPRRLAVPSAALSLLLLLLSLSVHAVTGHGPASSEPMSPLPFLRYHPAYPITAAAAIAALLLARR